MEAGSCEKGHSGPLRQLPERKNLRIVKEKDETHKKVNSKFLLNLEKCLRLEPVLTCKVHDFDLLLSLPLDAVVPFLFVPVVFCLTFQTSIPTVR